MPAPTPPPALHGVYRWSPCPQAVYRVRVPSGQTPHHMALGSTEAWNLAWLSHPFERNASLPYRGFVQDVLATLSESVSTGLPSGAGTPRLLSVRRITTLPAAEAAALLARAATEGADWPLLRHYGPALAPTWLSRAYLARGNHPAALLGMSEATVANTDAAQTLWRQLRRQWAQSPR